MRSEYLDTYRFFSAVQEHLGITSGPGDVPRIEGDELKGLLGDPEVVIPDVRRESAWSRSDTKVMGAIRENPEKFDSWVDKYPKDKTVVLYCT